MGFRFHRSIKILPGVRLNFGKRGISTSIGVRGAHVTYGPSGTRTTVGLPGTGITYTHVVKRHGLPAPKSADAPTGSAASPGSAGRGILWIGLLGLVLIVLFGRLTNQPPPLPESTPPQTIAHTATQPAEYQKAAQAKSAALGVGQIRQTIANSGTLKLSRVTVMPNGATCYEFHLQNSRGITYLRTAILDGGVLKPSGSTGFTGLWNRVCAHGSGRDITAQIERLASLDQVQKRQE
jgi:hypothetical protein